MDELNLQRGKSTGKFSLAEWLLLATAGLAFSAVVGIVGFSNLLV